MKSALTISIRALAACSAVAGLVVVGLVGAHRAPPIAAEPIARHAVVPMKTRLAPGIARPRDVRPLDSSGPRPLRTPPVDRTDPYTGEDLTAKLELAAAMQPRLELDRRDPYDPAIEYSPRPGLRLPFDEGDPWARRAGDNSRVAER